MKKEKIRLKLHLGIHIPLEICDSCKHRCLNYGKDHNEINKKRRKIAEYLKSINIAPIYIYNSLPDLYDAIGFDCCHPLGHDSDADYSLNNSIMILDTNDRTGNLVIESITNTVEDEWHEELQKFGKITYFCNILKNR